jgi:BirA family biotin operon repressor/biotin-[acetyl-CoA-carboxylase] ligase
VLLKWPNDLMLQDRKLGGILIETRIAEAEIVRVVIGVGINWENPVPDTGINLRSFLNSTAANSLINPPCDLEALAAIVVQGLVMGYQTWQRQGLTSLLSDYQALLTTLGRSVRVEGQAGIVTGVTANGHLKVQLLSDHSEQEYQPGRISIGY